MDGLSMSCSINISERDADEVTEMDVLVMEETVGAVQKRSGGP